MSTPSEPIRISSDRSFCFVFVAFFLFIATSGLKKPLDPSIPWVIVSLVFLLVGAFKPSWAHPLNRAWARFGILLSKVMNPLIMGFLYFVLVTPIALLLRLMGKDLLGLKLKEGAASYWVRSESSIPLTESMRNQF